MKAVGNATVRMGWKQCPLRGLLCDCRERPNLGSGGAGATEVASAGGNGWEQLGRRRQHTQHADKGVLLQLLLLVLSSSGSLI